MAKATKPKQRGRLPLTQRPPGTIIRADGRETKRINPYLPVELHRRFVTYCASNYRDQSEVAAAAISAYLEAHESRA